MRLSALLFPSLILASVFDIPELPVAPSPDGPKQIVLGAGTKVVDFDVSPAGQRVALLVSNASGAAEVLSWKIGDTVTSRVWTVPAGFTARSLAWHPLANAFFVSGPHAIFKVEDKAGAWTARQIYTTPREIRRLVPAPRPYDQGYRLFFAVKSADGRYSIHSITETGAREYQAIGPKESMSKIPDADGDPSEIVAPSALPVGFHPAGHLMLWEDGKSCFHVARYARDHWSKTARLFNRDVCGGTVSATPNGMGILQWVKGHDGATLFLYNGTTQKAVASGYQLLSPPSSTPDGRGIVGITQAGAALAVNYIPIDVPLADNVNAWMFYEAPGDISLFEVNGGLFRDLKEQDQLYQLYDSELYECGGLDESSPTRPYLVTTDNFWELFAAAYEGIFIVRERQIAIPAFWQFVKSAEASLREKHPQSPWAAAFAALVATSNNDEAARIEKAEGRAYSPVVKAEFDYGELKPRGHYTATPEAERYFRAFHYLTRISASPNLNPADLQDLPPEVRDAALRWIGAYTDLIAPPRSPLIWESTAATDTKPTLFPLSWGFDNEILNATIYHAGFPENQQIKNAQEFRVTPSGLDIAAAMGSRFARELLAPEIARYPRLGPVLDGLAAHRPAAEHNIYQQWIETLGEQWADATPSPNGPIDEKLWRMKRLQTGLASWATLRHATVLVNERVSAECGEGDFEFLIMRPPRGYVEPDPETFGKIADVFDAVRLFASAPDGPLTGLLPLGEDADRENREALQKGLQRRLTDTAAKARLFQSIAAKETRREPLTSTDYEEILYFGRVAEHEFLIFKSLANKDLALSTPNPIPKIADVSDVAGSAPYLFAAVGRPLEWDHTVPYFGRHEIVKGAAYSFYEFTGDKLLDDDDWLKRVATEPHPAWIAPFVSPQVLSCPARDPF